LPKDQEERKVQKYKETKNLKQKKEEEKNLKKERKLR